MMIMEWYCLGILVIIMVIEMGHSFCVCDGGKAPDKQIRPDEGALEGLLVNVFERFHEQNHQEIWFRHPHRQNSIIHKGFFSNGYRGDSV
jgi:hypothetical protein